MAREEAAAAAAPPGSYGSRPMGPQTTTPLPKIQYPHVPLLIRRKVKLVSPRFARQVLLMPSAAGAGDQDFAIAAATYLITDAKGWTWYPFLGHFPKHEKPICQRLQNVAPNRIRRVIIRHIPQVFYPGRRRRHWIRQELWSEAPSAGIRSCPGVLLLPPPPLPAPDLLLHVY